MKWLIKYWAQITGILTVLAFFIAWCWKLALRIEDSISAIQLLEARVKILETRADANDDLLDDHDRRIVLLEKVEELREKKLMK